jgi:hypothetical protein
VHDIASLEAAGIPGVVLCTTPFERAARLQSEALGFDPPLRVIAVGHPLGSMPVERVLAEAEAAVERVAANLTQRED